MDTTYRTPDNPGFIAGFQWQGFLAKWGARLFTQELATGYIAWCYQRAGRFIPDAHITFLGVPLYAPWRWFIWEGRYWHDLLFGEPQWKYPLSTAIAIGIVGFIVSGMIPELFFKVKLRRLAKNQDQIYGSTHWATEEELINANLLGSDAGIPICAIREESSSALKYLYDDSDRHVLVCAPTGTGKTMAVVIPIALTYRGSMVCLDIKEEIYQNTAGFRQKLGQVCLKWSPTQREGCTRINPLVFVRIGTEKEISDCSLIADALCQPGNEGETSAHWNDTSASVVAGLILHECYKARNEKYTPTLRGVSQMLSPRDETIEELFKKIAKYPHDPKFTRGWKDEAGKPSASHPVVAEKMAEALQRAEDEGSSVISTAKKRFSLFADPLVDYATSESNLQIEDLVDGRHPVSLYLVIPPSQQERLSIVIRLIVLTLLDRLTEQQTKHRHELLWMLDEFPSLGNLKPMRNALAYVRGYGMRFVLIIQNIGQIISTYGPHNSIIPNCQDLISFTPSPLDTQTAKTISEAMGSFTVQHVSYNVSGMPQMTATKGLSTHVQNTKRDLMMPDEILFGLKLAEKQGRKVVAPGEAIVLVFGCRPIKGWQTFCFLDPKMRAWMKLKPTDQSKALLRQRAIA